MTIQGWIQNAANEIAGCQGLSTDNLCTIIAHHYSTGCVRPTINMSQAMTLVGVSRRTIYNWMRDGKLTVLRTPMKAPRFYADELVMVGVTRRPSR